MPIFLFFLFVWDHVFCFVSKYLSFVYVYPIFLGIMNMHVAIGNLNEALKVKLINSSSQSGNLTDTVWVNHIDLI